MKRRFGLNHVERALLAARWKKETVSAGLHALIGEDGIRMVHAAGKTMYVVLGACVAADLDADRPDLRILRGAVNALHEQAEEARIDPARRAAIVSGLEACNRLLPELTQRQISDAALDLELKLLRGDVHYSDFEALTKRERAPAA